MEPENGPDWKAIFLHTPGVVFRLHVGLFQGSNQVIKRLATVKAHDKSL